MTGASPAEPIARIAVLGVALCAAACGGGGVRGSPSATDAEWQALASPRPSSLPGAARLSLADVQLAASPPWPAAAPVPPALGLSELITTGLLRRSDVHLVERRRFAAAAQAERSGTTRPAGAPAVGVSPGAQVLATLVWIPLGGERASWEVRLTDTETGTVVGSDRVAVPADGDPVGLARAAVGAILGVLDRLGRLPAWDDPVPSAAPRAYAPSDVSSEALTSFLQGLAAEEAWRWEFARVGYQAARRSAGFFEATVALARTARLRTGGTLGES